MTHTTPQQIDFALVTGGYVCHFINFINENDHIEAAKNKADIFGIDTLYEIALRKAKKIGGKRYHNKRYGGGILFNVYSSDKQELTNKINDLKNSAL